MWEDIYIWIESYAGCSYDVTEYLRALKDDAIFLSPRTWRNTLTILLQCLSDMIDVIDENWQMIPEHLPSKVEMKKFITSEILTQLIDIINKNKQKLNIEPTPIRTFMTLEQHVDVLYDLITALGSYSMESLIKKEWFDEYEESHNGFLTNVFGISKNDLPSMQFTVRDIKQMHEHDEE